MYLLKYMADGLLLSTKVLFPRDNYFSFYIPYVNNSWMLCVLFTFQGSCVINNYCMNSSFTTLLNLSQHARVTLLKATTASVSITEKSEASSQRNGTVLEHANSIAQATVTSVIKPKSIDRHIIIESKFNAKLF